MSNLTFLKRVAQRFPKGIGQVNRLAFVQYSGMINYLDGFVVADTIVHPFMDDIANDDFLSAYLERPRLASVPSGLNIKGQGSISQADVGDRIPDKLTKHNFGDMPYIMTIESIDWDEKKVGQPIKAVDFEVNADYVALTPKMVVGDYSINTSYVRPYKSDRIPPIMISVVHGDTGVIVSSSSPCTIDLKKQSAETLAWLQKCCNAEGRVLATDMPIKYWGLSASYSVGDTQLSNDLPRIRGYSRTAIRFPRFSSINGYPENVQIQFYSVGNGPDMIIDDFNQYADIVKTGATSYHVLCQRVLSRLVETSTYTTTHGPLRPETWWPISGLPWIKSLSISDFQKKSSSVITFDGQDYILDVYSAVVDQVSCNVLPDEYSKYVSTGFGLYKSLTGDALVEHLDTWNEVSPNGVAVRIYPVDLSGCTVRDLDAYRAYGKARDRACKTNDFMSKMYNQSLSYEQIDERLRAMTTVTVTVQDMAIASSVTPQTASTKVVTYTASTFTAVITNGGTYVLNTLDDVANLFTELAYATYSLPADLTKRIDVLTGGSSATNETSQMSKEMTSLTIMGSLFGVDVKQSTVGVVDPSALSKQDRIKFAMRQCSDFAQFRSNFVKVLSSFGVAKVVNVEK